MKVRNALNMYVQTNQFHICAICNTHFLTTSVNSSLRPKVGPLSSTLVLGRKVQACFLGKNHPVMLLYFKEYFVSSPIVH